MKIFIIMHNDSPKHAFIGSDKQAYNKCIEFEMQSYLKNTEYFDSLKSYRVRNRWWLDIVPLSYSLKR